MPSDYPDQSHGFCVVGSENQPDCDFFLGNFFVPGTYVVFFGDKGSKTRQISDLLVQLRKKYPSVHFVEVSSIF